MRMVDRVDLFDAGGRAEGLGFIRGTTRVNTEAWFFKAHFFEDPVWPGSLGLESFLQLLKVVGVSAMGRMTTVDGAIPDDDARAKSIRGFTAARLCRRTEK